MKYIALTTDENELVKPVPRNKKKIFKGVLLICTNEPLEEMLRPIRIDLVDLHNVNIEVKRLQVEHSCKDITFPLLPHNTDIEFVQEQTNKTLNKALEEEHDRNQSGTFIEPYHQAKTIASAGFPANTWQKYTKGHRPSYNQENKNQYHLEYEAKLKPTIAKVMKRWKELLRLKLGRKMFPMFGALKEGKQSTMTKYVRICNFHLAAMEALSVIELKGVKNLESKISVKLNEGGGEKSLSVRELLMESKLRSQTSQRESKWRQT